ncbi:MAG: SAF domain-containing protein [Candidatus Obscuribacterales bacterium]
MTRFAVILVITCALSLGICCLGTRNDDTKKLEQRVSDRMKERGTLVYARRDIKVGSLITAESVEQRPVMQCQIPGAAVCKASDVIGRRAVYGIGKGQILSNFDFLLPEQKEKYRSTYELPPIRTDR